MRRVTRRRAPSVQSAGGFDSRIGGLGREVAVNPPTEKTPDDPSAARPRDSETSLEECRGRRNVHAPSRETALDGEVLSIAEIRKVCPARIRTPFTGETSTVRLVPWLACARCWSTDC